MTATHCQNCHGLTGRCSRCKRPRDRGVRCPDEGCRGARWKACPAHTSSSWVCDCCKAVLAPPTATAWTSWPWHEFHKKGLPKDMHLCPTCDKRWDQLVEEAELILWDRLEMDRGDKNTGLVFTTTDSDDNGELLVAPK